MLPELQGALPKGWPPLAPSQEIQEKLHSGKVLLAEELVQLQADAAKAERLENTDGDFQRAVRRYRTACAEEDRIEEVRRELEEKARAVDGARNRVQQQRAAKMEARNRRRERGHLTRQEVAAARDARRNQLMERIALTERRALVRETIQKALVSQSRTDGHAERIMFTHPKMLSDGPGPGTYVPPPEARRGGALFVPHGEIDIRKTYDPRPGPGSYDPKYKGGPAATFGQPRPTFSHSSTVPGPGAYHYVQPVRKGGRISSHRVKSELEFALERAAQQPGPGQYELKPFDPGKSSTMSGRTRAAGDLVLLQNARRPGPGTYELPSARVRGGVMAHTSRDPGSRVSLPAIVPGPGSYHSTPTIHQEKEMRELSKQVVRLVKNRSVLSSTSAPESLASAYGAAGATRPRARTQAGLHPQQRPQFRSGLASATVLE